MGDVRSEATTVADSERQAEWERQTQEESGQPAKAPESSDPAVTDPDPGANGQADPGSPSSDSDPGRAAEEKAPAEPDPWADAPAALREAYEAERKAREKAENHVRTQGGRLSATQRRLLDLEARLKPEAKEEKQEAKPVLTDEARNALREEYPDVAGPLLDAIGALEAQQADLSKREASREEQNETARQLEAQRFFAEQEQTLAEKHPDWTGLRTDKAFADWAAQQPAFIQEGLARNGSQIVDAAEAAKIIDLFKTETNYGARQQQQERRDRQLAGSEVPRGKVPGATTSTATDRESYWKQLDAKEAAKR